ncbi:hypothetical protein HKCCSP123_13150 [Rhodobacterales bacterium HKCCSP123]|nr:hypothetical protein [Rhodobacterales bacterium HKCCSP123]
MRLLDLISALAMMALIALVVVATRDLAFWNGVFPGPRFLPLLLAGTTALLAIALFVSAVRGTGNRQPVDWPDRTGLARIGAFYLAAIGFGVIGSFLGFVTSAIVFLLFTMVVVLRRPIVPSLITTAVTSLIVYVIFIGWLDIRLPLGPFGF